jgi:hypothetical protein
MSKLADVTHSSTAAIAARGLFKLSPTQQGYADRLALLERTYKLPSGLLSYEAMKETGMSFDAKYNKPNAKGAVGTFQLTPIALKEIYDKANLKIDPTDPLQSALGAAVYNSIQQQRFGSDFKKLAASFNAGPGSLNRTIKKYGSDWAGHVNPETTGYIAQAPGVHINITNATGGNAIVQAAALAH